MPVLSVGDMAQQFISMRNSSTIKTELADLAESMSSGRVTDVTRTLNGDTVRLSGLVYSLSQLDGYQQAVTETTQILAGMQAVLGQVDTMRADTAEQLLLVSDESTLSQVNEAARAARDRFGEMVTVLNTQIADRALMSGTSVDSQSLANPEDMLADMQTAIGGATDFATIEAAIDTWFDDPAGGFATMGYQGDTGAIAQRRVSDTNTVRLDARADDPAIKETLKGAAMAAMANDLTGLDQATKATLLKEAGAALFTASSELIGVRTRIGAAEAEVAQTETEMNAQRTSFEIARSNLVAADPFDTASRLQSVQLQLETHYSVTARLSQLSLLRYI
ncbi:flagellin [Yoonia sp. BS5-3]|uniref:Flagellin n=1 Tax=Yoonia phaeophyticola TaxID=3137369 RepID=A0ABZ2VB00_9RHOB